MKAKLSGSLVWPLYTGLSILHKSTSMSFCGNLAIES